MPPRANDLSTTHPPGATDRDSLDLILAYARQSYDQQFASLDAYRARAGSLLAFAAVLVTLAAGDLTTGHDSTALAAGTLFVLQAAVLFLIASAGRSLQVAPSTRTLASAELRAERRLTEERVLRSTLDVLDSNHRVLSRARALLSVGLLSLLVGTVIIGLRLALLLT